MVVNDLPQGLTCKTGGTLNPKGFPSILFFFIRCSNNKPCLYLQALLRSYSLPVRSAVANVMIDTL